MAICPEDKTTTITTTGPDDDPWPATKSNYLAVLARPRRDENVALAAKHAVPAETLRTCLPADYNEQKIYLLRRLDALRSAYEEGRAQLDRLDVQLAAGSGVGSGHSGRKEEEQGREEGGGPKTSVGTNPHRESNIQLSNIEKQAEERTPATYSHSRQKNNQSIRSPVNENQPTSGDKPQNQSADKDIEMVGTGPQPITRPEAPTTAASRFSLNCIFEFAGCKGTFAGKTEWKRHVKTQHLRLNIWICSLGGCSGDNAEFNSKDRFTMHIKRMHKEHVAGEKENVQKALRLRCEAPTSICCLVPKCQEVSFPGARGLNDYMEHVADHMRRGERCNVNNDGDNALTKWASHPNVAIIERQEGGGGWVLKKGSSGWRSKARPERPADRVPGPNGIPTRPQLDTIQAVLVDGNGREANKEIPAGKGPRKPLPGARRVPLPSTPTTTSFPRSTNGGNPGSVNTTKRTTSTQSLKRKGPHQTPDATPSKPTRGSTVAGTAAEQGSRPTTADSTSAQPATTSSEQQRGVKKIKITT